MDPKAFGVRLEDCLPAANNKVSKLCEPVLVPYRMVSPVVSLTHVGKVLFTLLLKSDLFRFV